MLVNRPFTNWIKVHKIVQGHESNSYHFHAVQEGLDFQRSVKQPQTNIDVCMSTELFQCFQENQYIIKCCAECIFYCGQQCNALRGDVERVNMPGNSGKILDTLKLLATHCPVLKAHLVTPH